eukprot:scaffold41939_cov23-Tisochrysis_lutea.AAC.3
MAASPFTAAAAVASTHRLSATDHSSGTSDARASSSPMRPTHSPHGERVQKRTAGGFTASRVAGASLACGAQRRQTTGAPRKRAPVGPAAGAAGGTVHSGKPPWLPAAAAAAAAELEAARRSAAAVWREARMSSARDSKA